MGNRGPFAVVETSAVALAIVRGYSGLRHGGPPRGRRSPEGASSSSCEGDVGVGSGGRVDILVGVGVGGDDGTEAGGASIDPSIKPSIDP